MIRLFTNSIRRSVIRTKDAVKYSPPTSRLILAGTKARMYLAREDAQRAHLLMRAYRLAENKTTREALLVNARPFLNGASSAIWRDKRIGWARYPRAAESPRINRTIILKAPRSNGEKGVMLVMFEYNWLRLLANVKDLNYLSERFDIVLSTSWS